MLVNDRRRVCASILPQGEKITALFGRSYDLAGKGENGSGVVLKPFTVNITYHDLSGKIRTAKQTIDVSQFLGLKGLFAKPVGREIAETLAKIEKHLTPHGRENITSNNTPDVTQIDSKYRQADVPGHRED